MKLIAVLTLSFLFMTGCSTVRYSCTGSDKNASGCSSLSEVAQRTNKDITPVAIESNNSNVISRKVALKNTAKKLQELPVQGMNRANVGQPILTQPKTMRIFYTPFKDEQGDLNVGGFVYVQLTDPEWVIAQ